MASHNVESLLEKISATMIAESMLLQSIQQPGIFESLRKASVSNLRKRFSFLEEVFLIKKDGTSYEENANLDEQIGYLINYLSPLVVTKMVRN